MSEIDTDRIQELDKATMFTNCPTAEGKRSKMSWSVRKTYPRISVFTNDPMDKSNGLISAPIDTLVLHSALSIMEKTINAENESKQKLDIYVSKWENGQRTNERELLATLWIGKNSHGINWISLISSDPTRPKIIFEYQLSDYYNFFKADGTPYTKAEGSNLALAASIRLIRNFFENSPYATATPNKPPRQPGLKEFSTDPTPTSTFEDVNF
jgi:hypothetical protein